MKTLSIVSALFLTLSANSALAAGAYDFKGIVKLSDCSGSLVRFDNSKETDTALIMTNGHCVSSGMFGGMMDANTFVSHKAESRKVQFLKEDGSVHSGSETTKEVVYGTITWNDVSIYKLSKTYQQIKATYGVDPLLIDSGHASIGDSIELLSGYWQSGTVCKIEAFAYELHEDVYISKDSMRFAQGCDLTHGGSGTPVISQASGKVVGVFSTGNDSGERCTMDNPCEVSQSGAVYFKQGINYADQIAPLYTCLNAANEIDLTVPGCKLYH
jgi:hypothetical protein